MVKNVQFDDTETCVAVNAVNIYFISLVDNKMGTSTLCLATNILHCYFHGRVNTAQ